MPHPSISPGAKIHPTAVIYDNVIIGRGVEVGPFCIIGAPPESINHTGSGKGVIIRDNTKLHGAVTIDAGTEGPTIIGDNCYLMKQTHVGHDALLFEGVIMAPHATVGGFAVIGRHSNLGMNSVVHQRQEVGMGCMLGAGSVVVRGQTLEDYGTYVGAPARRVGENFRGREKCK